MAFNKRRKQPHLFRGANPFPTAEELASDAGTHVGLVPHAWPHPTDEQRALMNDPEPPKKRGKLGRSKKH